MFNSLPIKSLKFILLPALSILGIISCVNNTEHNVISYPAIISHPITENYHNTMVEDRFRNLEGERDSVIDHWIDKENKLCDSILKGITYQDSLNDLLKNIIYSSNIRGGFPRAAGKRLFFSRNHLQEKTQKLLYRDSLNSTEIELYNTTQVNTPEKTFNISFFEPSFDGKYIAFGLSSTQEEATSIRIIDVDKRMLLPEVIDRTTYGQPFWLPNKEGFFYTQLKELKSAEDVNSLYENSVVKLHLIGNKPTEDKICFSHHLNADLPLQDLDFSFLYTFPVSSKIIASSLRGSTAYMSLYFTETEGLITKSPQHTVWKKIADDTEKITSFTLNKNDLFFISFKDHSNGVLKKIDLNSMNSAVTVIAENKDEVMEEIIQTKHAIYLKKLKNGISLITEIDIATNKINELTLPFKGYAYLKPAFDIAPAYLNSEDFYFGLESWNREICIFSYNARSNKVSTTNLRKQGDFENILDVKVEEIEIPSHDGAMVPLSIIYLKDLKLNGQNPTLIEGYGAYGLSMNASFNPSLLAWLKMGGIYAVAHVRGGSEKGDKWYKGGYKSTKANTWKDFIACSEYLIEKKYTSAEKLAAKGSSAGGITVGRAITNRPDLYKAAILEVCELNTLRSEYSRNTLSISEFGTVKDPSDFKNLYEMDVYHHIKNGITYPSLLLTSGLSDSRVDWWQPAKAAIRFQECATGKNNIVLFKINTSGHDGNPDKIKEDTEYYSFLLWQLNHPKFKQK